MGAAPANLPAVQRVTGPVTGRTLGERLEEPLDWVDRKVIRPFDDPVSTSPT